jgi:hypothetical protein
VVFVESHFVFMIKDIVAKNKVFYIKFKARKF